MSTTPCPHHARHWYAYYGWPGSSAPTCRRCHQPNPNYDPTRDPYATDPKESTPCPTIRLIDEAGL